MNECQINPPEDRNISPDLTLSKTDPGDEVQKRFRYQHTYTALIAIQMFAGNLPYKEIMCELHEDILGVCSDGKFEGIQVKTKQINDGEFELNDEAITKSLIRFIKLYNDFPGKFKKFIFVSNCPIRDDSTGKSLINLVKQSQNVLKDSKIPFTPSTLEKYIEILCEKTSLSREIVIEVLALVKTQVGPSMDDIESKILTDHLGSLKECSNTLLPQLRIILDSIINKVYFASSKRTLNPIKDYIALTDGNFELLEYVEINTKRITKDTIRKVLREDVNKNLFLKSRNGFPESDFSKQNSNLMKHKMHCGMIDGDSIEIMDDLMSSAEDYFFEKYYKTNNPPKTIDELDQIRTIILNQANEAKSRCKNKEKIYGTIMLHSIEDRLEKITEKRSEHVYYCPYEILKGLVGILTNECKIAFSEEPEGGWKLIDTIPS